MMICELRKMEPTEAMIVVPSRIGQNWLLVKVKNRSMHPKKEIMEAIRKTTPVR